MAYAVTFGNTAHRNAVRSVVAINLESAITANMINTFRNVFPSISGYFKEVVLNFTSVDETDFNYSKVSHAFGAAQGSVDKINFMKFGHTLLQTPEGFKGRYPEYLNWLTKEGMNYIDAAKSALDNYYRELSIFISSKEAKLSLKDYTRLYGDMEKALEGVKDGLGSFFDSRTANALRTADSLFDRASDISVTIKAAGDLNRKRLTIKGKEIMNITNEIANLINLLVETSENDKIPQVSGPAAQSIAQGAMVIAHYIEFIGVLRYRIEEAINAVGIMSEQVVKYAKEQK